MSAEPKSRSFVLIAFVLLIFVPALSSAVEHPGVLHKDDVCSTCHADKTSGKSVHSAMQVSCTVCHLAQTQGDMTTVNLLMPKEQICFACHEKTAGERQHSPAAKGLCVDCHDSHSSGRRMLLHDPAEARQRSAPMLPPSRATE
jgi:predicted CXXCH cytochrome family protein